MGHSTRRLMMGAAGSGKSTYVDDVFSTYIYEGTQTAKTITNGIDLAGEGGMVWIKNRVGSWGNNIFDTERGPGKIIRTNNSNAYSQASFTLNAFNSDGFGIGNDSMTNANGGTTVSWSFRKSPGFFDVVTYTGTGSARTIDHNLGCVPGCIIIKQTNSSSPWSVYHKFLDSSNTQTGDTDPEDWRISLDEPDQRMAADSTVWNATKPTSTAFSVGTNTQLNGNGDTYVAYLFAGGDSSADTARSVNFSVSTDASLSIADHSDFHLGSGDFTIECWCKLTSANGAGQECFINQWVSGNYSFFFGSVSGLVAFHWSTNGSATANVTSDYTITADGQWHHYAVSRNGNTLKIFVDGIQRGVSYSMSGVTINDSTQSIVMGNNPDVSNGSRHLNGNLSNVRIVKGTAVYTENFIPSKEPLTNITNTKLLCCNNSSTTGATVTPGTITAVNSPTARAYSPFDDPKVYTFGEEGDQNIIKTGSYHGNGSATAGPEIVLGWEPQWILVKNTISSGNWLTFDCIRGLFVGINDVYVSANTADAETTITGAAYIEPTSRGFKIRSSSSWINQNYSNYIFIAIRRSDGYVTKPAEAGTDVFAMDTGAGTTTIPNYDSGFPVDMSLRRQFASSDSWVLGTRLMGGKILETNDTDAEQNAGSNWAWDSNVGWSKEADNSTYQSWMWKRGQGFDVVNWTGNAVAGRDIEHSLGKIPEMIWLKQKSGTERWIVYQKGLNGGTNPFEYELRLNSNIAEGRWSNFYDTAPTALNFRVDGGIVTNGNNQEYMALLFASVEGISKCGYYTGTGAAGNTQTTGFTPRFILVKCVSDTVDWGLFDSVRGLGSSGDDQRLYLNTDAAQVGGYDYLTTSATGFTPAFVGSSVVNASGQKFIYYAHA